MTDEVCRSERRRRYANKEYSKMWRVCGVNDERTESARFQRSRHTCGGTVRQQTTPANRDYYYPDSLLFVSADFLPRVSSQLLN